MFVGDAMEEKIDDLCQAAGELGLLGVPAFMFQEGYDADRRTGVPRDRAPDQGRLLPLRSGLRPIELGELLRAVAAYAAGGMRALADLSARRDAGAIKLIAQMK